MFAPPDFGGVSPPGASKTLPMTIGGGDFQQGFAASGCIGSSASGCQPKIDRIKNIS